MVSRYRPGLASSSSSSPTSPAPLAWPTAAMQAKLIALAQHAAPRECCGWVTLQAVRNADNISVSPTHFEFAAPDLFALAQALALPADHPDRPLAIFHSHPHGPDQLSADDIASAILQVGMQAPQPTYTAQQLLIVGPRWHVQRFEFDVTSPTRFRRLGADR